MASVIKNNKKSGTAATKSAVGKVTSKKVIFHSDSSQTQFLVKAAKRVSAQAIREAKALGLEIMYIENGVLYREKDGEREVVIVANEPPLEKYTKLKKGVTLYVKK